MKNVLLAVSVIGLLTPVGLSGQSTSPPPVAQTALGSEPRQPCDRGCLIEIVDNYVTSLIKKDPASVPTSEETWYTENTARLNIGEGVLWRANFEPTGFKIHAADPVFGQVALQAVFNIEGRPALTVIRLKVERRHITEIEHLVDRNVAKEAMELLTSPPAAARVGHDGDHGNLQDPVGQDPRGGGLSVHHVQLRAWRRVDTGRGTIELVGSRQ